MYTRFTFDAYNEYLKESASSKEAVRIQEKANQLYSDIIVGKSTDIEELAKLLKKYMELRK